MEERIVRLENEVASLSTKVARINDKLDLDRAERRTTARSTGPIDYSDIRNSGVVIGATMLLWGALKFLNGPSFSPNQRIFIALAASVLIWSVTFFVSRRRSRAE